MNILTYDIEEWYLEKTLHGGRREKFTEFDRYLNLILDKLDEREIKGTFFCLGSLVHDFNYVIKEIHKRGHEVGCHSNKHNWLNHLSRKEAHLDTKQAIDSLEQCIGTKVKSYRAPAFSIGEKNKWAFEVLAECGIEIDASVHPADRDFGGFTNFGSKSPCIIEMGGIRIKEFPICTTPIIGKELAYSGGGYFRFFPYIFIKNKIKNSEYTMTYFHIGDLMYHEGGIMPRKKYEEYYKETGTLKNRLIRYVKTNHGTKGAFDKMCTLIEENKFISLREADKMIDWNSVKQINL